MISWIFIIIETGITISFEFAAIDGITDAIYEIPPFEISSHIYSYTEYIPFHRNYLTGETSSHNYDTDLINIRFQELDTGCASGDTIFSLSARALNNTGTLTDFFLDICSGEVKKLRTSATIIADNKREYSVSDIWTNEVGESGRYFSISSPLLVDTIPVSRTASHDSGTFYVYEAEVDAKMLFQKSYSAIKNTVALHFDRTFVFYFFESDCTGIISI